MGIVTAPLGGRLVSAFGAKATLVVAAVLASAGFAFLAVVHSTTWQVIAGSVIVNTGVMFGYAALPALIVEHVDRTETGIANSVNSISRSVGMSLGTAFVVALLARHLVPGTPLPDESQFTLIFVIGAALCGVTALVLGWALPRSRPSGLTVAEAEEQEVIGAAGVEIPAGLIARQRSGS